MGLISGCSRRGREGITVTCAFLCTYSDGSGFILKDDDDLYSDPKGSTTRDGYRTATRLHLLVRPMLDCEDTRCLGVGGTEE